MRIQQLTDLELSGLMNDAVAVFEKKGFCRGYSGMTLKVGFLSLTREATRRGLKTDKDRFGKIILVPKN